MLYILYDNLECYNLIEGVAYKLIRFPKDYFDNFYTLDWLNNDTAKQIILDIDKSYHIKDNLIESDYLGAFSPKQLSSGCKTLLCMLNADLPENTFWYGGSCGDNCGEWIHKIGKEKDIRLNMEHIIQIGRTVDNFEVTLVKNNQTYHTYKEFMNNMIAIRYDYDDDFMKKINDLKSSNI